MTGLVDEEDLNVQFRLVRMRGGEGWSWSYGDGSWVGVGEGRVTAWGGGGVGGVLERGERRRKEEGEWREW